MVMQATLRKGETPEGDGMPQQKLGFCDDNLAMRYDGRKELGIKFFLRSRTSDADFYRIRRQRHRDLREELGRLPLELCIQYEPFLLPHYIIFHKVMDLIVSCGLSTSL